MAPSKTLWKLESHTHGKHIVLRSYLNAWLPIMSAFNGRILFVDGFAGPGEYQQGEDGSPIIALKALRDHAVKQRITSEICFVFIEADSARAKHLKNVVSQLGPLPGKCNVSIVNGTFAGTLNEILDSLDSKSSTLAPAFVMIDPFGVSETPMSVVKRLLLSPKSEIFASFMYESINRFIGTPEFAPNLDSLFGSPDWRTAIALTGESRKDFLHDLYEAQLRAAGAKHVVHFELHQGNRHIYTIFHGTKHHTGCDRMKQAIWRIAPSGDFQFKSRQLGQLGMLDTDFDPLKKVLIAEFAGKDWVSIEKIDEFVASDRTAFHTSQFKSNVLKPLEQQQLIEVDQATRTRKFTYPDGVRLRFV